MLIVLARDVGRAFGVLVRAGDLQRFTYEHCSRRGTSLSCEQLVHAAADGLGQRDAALLGPPLQAAVLVGRQLDLCAHHGVRIVL